ncbi:hypothetical protein [Bordetella genomosp. 11]|uniref:Uncharacterized protein n=1 Tax=Bordetella genomosp. 11 TaxID=1416808 RepID=A0A261UHY9_9BORD|nr:hypothetical protein [Bordetella genomosp. 11]OZI61539.1 hypothetical protein CAL28_19850 [Bordetella genomosp. 11]
MHPRSEPCALSRADLATIAAAAGLLPPGSEMTSELLEYTRTVVGYCAFIGDSYTDEDGTAGDKIRAAFDLA